LFPQEDIAVKPASATQNKIVFFIVYWVNNYNIFISSTSKIRVAFAGILPPAPCSPYAKSEGIYNFQREPSGINCKASTQPGITDEIAETNKQAGKEFLAENAKRSGVVVLPSGLQYEVLAEGKGRKPKVTDKVQCHYHAET